jgi:hypothetical protein
MDEKVLEVIVAAILTAASVDQDSHGVDYMVNRYGQVLRELRKAGGPINPVSKQ